MSATHDDVIAEIMAQIKALDLGPFGVRSTDVHERDFPFNGSSAPPCPSIILSRVIEAEGPGLNNAQDIAYPVQVLRCGHSLSNRGGSPRTGWRDLMRDTFNHKRIGVDGELVTKVRFLEMQYDSAWKSWNLDTSGLRIITWVRKAV
jgi:hypothetical protein